MDGYNAPPPPGLHWLPPLSLFSSGISLGETRGPEMPGAGVKEGARAGRREFGGKIPGHGQRCDSATFRGGKNPKVGPEGGRAGGGQGRRSGWGGLAPGGHRGPETGGMGHGWGWGALGGPGGDGEPGSPPPARPGPPADSAPRRPRPRPRLTVREAAPAEAAGEGDGRRGRCGSGCGSGRRLRGGGS